MADLRVVIDGRGAALSTEFRRIAEAIPVASARSMANAAGRLKVEGHANIAGAGFGARWQNGWKVSEGLISAVPTILARHTIGYSEVFEDGAVIDGKPLLWLPLPGVPRSIGGKRTTAALWERSVGPLFLLKGGSHPLLLGAPSGAVRSLRKTPPRARHLPHIIGLESLTIGKKFDLDGVTRKVAAQVPGLFDQALKELI